MKIYGELFCNICDFWELESTQTGAHAAHHPPGRAPGPRRGVVGGGLLERRLELSFGRKEAYIRKKIMLKSERNRSYESLDIYETAKGQNLSSGNRREQRGRSNLRGAPAPPPPWQPCPWTRGGSLLPSREEAKE
jgi:hypothetical protein